MKIIDLKTKDSIRIARDFSKKSSNFNTYKIQGFKYDIMRCIENFDNQLNKFNEIIPYKFKLTEEYEKNMFSYIKDTYSVNLEKNEENVLLYSQNTANLYKAKCFLIKSLNKEIADEYGNIFLDEKNDEDNFDLLNNWKLEYIKIETMIRKFVAHIFIHKIEEICNQNFSNLYAYYKYISFKQMEENCDNKMLFLVLKTNSYSLYEYKI